MFSCPPSITKTKIWRIGIRIFGGSDVVNKVTVGITPLPMAAEIYHLEFGHSEKHTKFQKIIHLNLTIGRFFLQILSASQKI